MPARHWRQTALSAEPSLLYFDSSALVKLVIEEPESAALALHLEAQPTLATSRLALVEVPRATALANPAPEVQVETARLLRACLLIDVSTDVLLAATRLTSKPVRTLDAIHLASAMRVAPDQFVAYDSRLAHAATAAGLAVAHPGAGRD